MKLRTFEWVFLGFFFYVALIAPFFHREVSLVVRTAALACSATALFATLSRLGQSRWRSRIAIAREWIAVLLTYVAFREMGWFATPRYNARLERAWMLLDRQVLGSWHGHDLVQFWGAFLPTYFEVCYLLVYGVAAYGLALIYVTRLQQQRRNESEAFLTLYLAGTLGAYSLFPYFPSEPPRFAFPAAYSPMPVAMHAVNVRLLSAGTIHSSVFPSAHVSSVMSAVWALFLIFTVRSPYGWMALLYAISVATATIYCRYHYTADVLAGMLISLLPAGLALVWRASRREPKSVSHNFTA